MGPTPPQNTVFSAAGKFGICRPKLNPYPDLCATCYMNVLLNVHVFACQGPLQMSKLGFVATNEILEAPTLLPQVGNL